MQQRVLLWVQTVKIGEKMTIILLKVYSLRLCTCKTPSICVCLHTQQQKLSLLFDVNRCVAVFACVCAYVCVDMYYSCCGDLNLFTQSHCGDSPFSWGQNMTVCACACVRAHARACLLQYFSNLSSESDANLTKRSSNRQRSVLEKPDQVPMFLCQRPSQSADMVSFCLVISTLW